jgi:hypothetical protein
MLMPVRTFFAGFEDTIRKNFDTAKAEAGNGAEAVFLELTDETRGLGDAKMDICAFADGKVRINLVCDRQPMGGRASGWSGTSARR